MKSINVSGAQFAAALAYVQYLCGGEVKLFDAQNSRARVAIAGSIPGSSLRHGRSVWTFDDAFADEKAQLELFEPDRAFIMEFARDMDAELVARRLSPTKAAT
jgi:hypothetical protein